MKSTEEESYILIKNSNGELEPREDSPDLIYKFLLAQKMGGYSLRVNKIEIPGEAYRKLISTQAFELLYMIKGKISYFLKEQEVILEEGDTFYFDGRIPHGLKNHENTPAEILKMYFISPSE